MTNVPQHVKVQCKNKYAKAAYVTEMFVEIQCNLIVANDFGNISVISRKHLVKPNYEHRQTITFAGLENDFRNKRSSLLFIIF